jgi:hypothetical protein
MDCGEVDGGVPGIGDNEPDLEFLGPKPRGTGPHSCGSSWSGATLDSDETSIEISESEPYER